MRISLLIIHLLFVLVVSSCDNEGVTNNHTNNTVNNSNNNLTISFVAPPDGELNILAGQAYEVRLKLIDSENRPVINQGLNLLITGQAGGSSLSNSSVFTDADGTVSFNVTAGKSASHFNIMISTANAPSIALDVTVSETGMAQFTLNFDYNGVFLDTQKIIEVGLLFNETCDSTNINTATLSRIRVVEDLNSPLIYKNLPVDVPFVFGGKLLTEDGSLLASGCLKPSDDILIPGGNITISLHLDDYVITLGDATSISFETNDSNISAWTGAKFAAWTKPGACTYGISMLFLDCLVSYLEAGDPSTCGPGTETDLSFSIKQLRGILDSMNCRGSLNGFGGASLENNIVEISNDIVHLNDRMSEFKDFIDSSPFESVVLDSSLILENNVFTHHLQSLTFPLISNTPNKILSIYYDNAYTTMSYSGIEHAFSVPLQGFKAGIGDLVKYILWNLWFKDYGFSFSGHELTAYIQEILENNSSLTYQEELISRIDNRLTAVDIDRAFTLMSSRLEISSLTPENFDLTVSGDLLFDDPDIDGKIDTITPNLSVIINPNGNLTVSK